MKKLFWLILALCLLAMPAMAEDACDHPYGSCDGRCYACNQYVDDLVESECPPYLIKYEYDDTQHWGVCSNCGTTSDKEQHLVSCGETECIACGMTATAETPLYHLEVCEDYTADGGYHWYDCLACGEKIDKEACDFRNWIVVDEVTCTEKGKERSVCFECGVGTMDREIEALGHNVTEWETVNEPAACMGYDGQKVGICDTCGEEIWKTIPFEGEILGEHVFETYMEMTPATCTEAGEEMSMCSLCGREASVREIPALGHDDSEMEVTKEPTCTEAGEKAGKCTRCGEVGETAEIPALGHDEVWSNTVEPTCLVAGEATGTCARCEAELGKKAVEALDHDDGEWVVVKEATREAEGLKELQCTRCGEMLDSEVIPMITIVWYPNNTACLDGVSFRDLENPVTDKWYTFVELDLSQDGVQTFELIASNIYDIGVVTVTVSGGSVTVDYQLVNNQIVVLDEFMTLFASLDEVTTVEQSAFTEYAFGEAINIQEALNGTTGYLYLCNTVTYHDQIYGIVRVYR